MMRNGLPQNIITRSQPNEVNSWFSFKDINQNMNFNLTAHYSLSTNQHSINTISFENELTFTQATFT